MNEGEAQANFVFSFHYHKITNHKFIELEFFWTNGFVFQNMLPFQDLETFIQMKGMVYSDLVKVFSKIYALTMAFSPHGSKEKTSY